MAYTGYYFAGKCSKGWNVKCAANVYIGGNEGLYVNIMNHMITSLRKEKG